MKSFILRFLTACVSYQTGESLTAATLPGHMWNEPFWVVIGNTFRYYSFGRFAFMAFMIGLLFLADRIGPKRIHIGWFTLIAAFCGGYCYAMGELGYLSDFENNMYLHLHPVLPEPIDIVVELSAFFLVAFFPFILLAIIKLAGLPRFRRRFAIGSSKA